MGNVLRLDRDDLRAKRHGRSPVDSYLAGLGSARSRKTMTDALRIFARFLEVPDADPRLIDWPAVQFSDLAAFRESCAGQAPATIRGRLAAVKGVLKCAWRDGLITAEELARAADVQAPKGRTLARGRCLSPDEVQRLFAVCAKDQSASGLRDAAVFALFRSGMRVSELLGVDLADFEPGRETAAVAIRHGKGGHQRLAYLSGAAIGWIERWLDVRGREPGPIVCSVQGGRPIPQRRIGVVSVELMCQRRAAQADIQHFSPHDFRRTVATELKDRGVDIADIRDFLGHANIQTTVAYFRNDKEESKRRAALVLNTPGGQK